MLFNSYLFILFFLPVCITVYFVLQHREQPVLAQIFLLGMSLWFYGYYNVRYLILIVLSVVFNYGYCCILNRFGRSPWARKCLLGLAVCFNLGILFYYKYFDFFLSNINQVFHRDFALQNILLPLGISFFTFQQLSFCIDVYQRGSSPYGFLQYALFVTYFPQLIAGPIVRHDEMIPQFEDPSRRHLNWDNLAPGLHIFALGLAKKVLLADTLGNAVNWGFANTAKLNSAEAIIITLSYTFQLYFDFSGYCDMAMGIAKMMNMELPLNFNSPYKALSISEFWDRWHMTLTRFFTQYVYIPLGGSRRGRLRADFNMLLVFLLSGLWHGAAWTFVLWGGLHGMFLLMDRHCRKWLDALPRWFHWGFTFGMVNLAWIFFRAASIKDGLRIVKRILQFQFDGVNENIVLAFHLVEFSAVNERFPFLPMIVFLALAWAFSVYCRNSYERMRDFVPDVRTGIVTAILYVWSILSFSGLHTFLYFNF